MYDLVTIGDAVLDTHVQIDNASVECDLNNRDCKLCLDYATKIPISGSFQSLGGNAANVGVGVARLGLKTGVITTLGKDSNGKIVIDELKKQKVDTGLISYDQEQTRYAIVLNYKGERTILSYHKKRNYAWPKKVEADWLYYTGASEGFESLQDSIVDHLDKHGSAKLAFNPGSFQIKNALDKVLEILPRTDILIVNLEEAEKISGLTMERAKSVPAIMHALMDLGAKEVAVTDASRGAWAGNEEEIYQMESYPVEVVAKTGAGDAFSSGYMAARFYEHGPDEALRWGVANSCGVIGHFGAQVGLLDKEAIKKMTEWHAEIVPKKVI